jgi:MYXO-CTERM domain-containing protein
VLRMRTSKKHSLLGFGIAVATLALASGAQAQSLRPNIMFVFDTSISMRDNSSGNQVAEGTNICGSGTTGSRLYGLKSGIRAALAQAGTDEANFGLMSFPTTVVTTPNTSQWCGTTVTGHYQGSPSRTSIATPNRGSSSNHGTTDYPVGCMMSSNSIETTYGSWFPTGAGEVVRVGVTTAAAGATPTAVNYDPVDGNIPAIYKWIDNVELPTTNAAVTDPELHANTYTPLGRSLFYARMYFDNLVKPADPKGSCRQNVVILVTDGAETCDESTAPNNTFVTTSTMSPPTDLCTGGGNYNPFHPAAQACLLQKSGIKVYVITDTTTGAANDTIAAAGGTGAAVRVSLTDANAAKTAIVGIIASTVPPVEVCNGKDDNCNGLIDEGVSNMCAVTAPNDANDPDNKLGTGAKHCAIETCNCIDDDCDGTVDEGFAPNACGQPCGCAIPAEKCDGLDNDCDGDIDEGFNVGASCTNNGVGACLRAGIMICNPTGSGTLCDAPAGTPMPEVCNGIDDDCDGMKDEGTLPGVGEVCGNGLGNCSAGTFVCMNGQLVCNATGNPQAEVCDGKDNNCDGIIDNGNFPQTGQPCLCDGLTQQQIDQSGGVCKAGHLVCRGALSFQCEGCGLPSPEICDGKDNNCDGMTDISAKCPSGFACRNGQCSLQCVGGEFSCPAGYKCVSEFCVPQRCANVTCDADQKCDEATGSCVSRCQGVTCASPKVCVLGRCLDCNDPSMACTAPEICVGGICKTDKCTDVSCPSDKYCADGVCVDLCIPGRCGKGERCAAGKCKPDVCDGKICSASEFCNPDTGACEPDRCQASQCGPGMSCVSMTNTCVVDPCSTIRCPSSCWHCGITKDGVGTCLLNDDCKPVATEVGQRGGTGGCACDTADSPARTSWLALFLFASAGLLARRRRSQTQRQRVRR